MNPGEVSRKILSMKMERVVLTFVTRTRMVDFTGHFVGLVFGLG